MVNRRSDFDEFLRIGPDQGPDIRTSRPYFLLPLQLGDRDQRPEVIDRIAAFSRQAMDGAPYTDIYVLAHGWHRNLFNAVASYDRLISRFSALRERRVLQSADPAYNPLFIALHWNSDPDKDEWLDTAGRRDKTSFQQQMAAAFEPRGEAQPGDLRNLFDRIYALFTYVSAPSTCLTDTTRRSEAEELFHALDEMAQVRDRIQDHAAPAITPAGKVSLAWRCYDESQPMRVLYGQSEQPAPFNTPWQAIKNLFKFSVAALAGTTLLATLTNNLGKFLTRLPLVKSAGEAAWNAVNHVKPVTWAAARLHQTLGVSSAIATDASLIVFLGLTSLAVLAGAALFHQAFLKHQGARGLPTPAIVSWIPAQIVLLVPAVIYLLATSLFRTGFVLIAVPFALAGMTTAAAGIAVAFFAFAWIASLARWPFWGIFNERAPAGIDAKRPIWTLRDWLAALARVPVYLLTRAIAKDSQVYNFAMLLDSQAAFFTMQRKGAYAGPDAAEFLESLHARLGEQAAGARYHLIGHSFGALLLANLARMLANRAGYQSPAAKQPDFVPAPLLRLQSICLLQAAMGSDWFYREKWAVDPRFLQGGLTCVYSVYDTANGFLYPTANSGRKSAGGVGLFRPGGATVHEIGRDPNVLAAVVRPQDIPIPPSLPRPHLLNIDASRFIYNGSVAVGGGHDDIFKDDVVNLVWAVTNA